MSKRVITFSNLRNATRLETFIEAACHVLMVLFLSQAKAGHLFSLSNQKSLRLKRWGSWIAYEDQNSSNKTYWYNHKTGTGQWSMPDSVHPMMSKQSFASHSSKSVLVRLDIGGTSY